LNLSIKTNSETSFSHIVGSVMVETGGAFKLWVHCIQLEQLHLGGEETLVGGEGLGVQKVVALQIEI
jgi:hypothetical protein